MPKKITVSLKAPAPKSPRSAAAAPSKSAAAKSVTVKTARAASKSSGTAVAEPTITTEPKAPAVKATASKAAAPKTTTPKPPRPTAQPPSAAEQPAAVQVPAEEPVMAQAATAPKVSEAPIESKTPAADAPFSFADLNLSEPLARAITQMGYETPTPIQEKSIPLLLAGRDLIGQANTGTGKTAAFGLPLIQMTDAASLKTQTIILEPTRELAVQVANSLQELSKYTRLRVVPVYGGQPIDRQFRALRDGAQVVVGTPGRVLDHLKRGTLTLDSLRLCVLDEADEMLALGFLEEVEGILAQMPDERQVAFFSATMPPRIAALTQKYLRNPARVVIASQGRTVDTTNQSYYEVPPGQKLEVLGRILALETPGPTIIFCRTRQETNDVAEVLRQRGYNAEPLHGDMNQSERDRVMLRFRQGQADILVATDVAARGLDIETVTHVINFDIPWDVEQYIHRVGRTGRAGRTGDAITLVSGRERQQLKFIERFIGAPIRWAKVPSLAEIAQRRRELFQESVRTTIIEGGYDRQMAMVEALAAEHDAKAVAAAALKMLWELRHGAQADAEVQDALSQRMVPAMTKIFIGLGRRDGLRPGDLVGAIANEANLKARSIGEIEILDATSFVDIPTSETERVIAALRRIKLRGRKVKIALADAAE